MFCAITYNEELHFCAILSFHTRSVIGSNPIAGTNGNSAVSDNCTVSFCVEFPPTDESARKQTSYILTNHPEWHKLGIFLYILKSKFNHSKPGLNQHFVYTFDCFLLLFISGMDVAVDGCLNICVPYNALNRLYRNACIVQKRSIGMSENMRRSPVKVYLPIYALHHSAMRGKGDGFFTADDISVRTKRLKAVHQLRCNRNFTRSAFRLWASNDIVVLPSRIGDIANNAKNIFLYILCFSYAFNFSL